MARFFTAHGSRLAVRFRPFNETSASELTGSWLLEDPAPTHELARAAYDCGVISGLKYPSSKHPAGWCLAIFTDRLALNPANYLQVIDKSSLLSQRLP